MPMTTLPTGKIEKKMKKNDLNKKIIFAARI